MLSLKFIQENKEKVIEGLAVKNFDASGIIEIVTLLDNQRKQTQSSLDNTLAEINNISRNIGILIKSNKTGEAESARKQTTELKEKSKELGQRISEIENELHNTLIQIPNIPHSTVPAGKGSAGNLIVREGGVIPRLEDGSLAHWDIAKKYNIIDFELGNKLTGSGFPVYKGKGARLQRSLISFFLDEAVSAGYSEVIPPLLVNEDSGFGTGQLPDKEGQMYYVCLDNFYLIPTAEVPVTNIYRDVILSAAEFPVKTTAYTPCFRREAGSYGKDVRGLNRLHQFDKVEIVVIEHPDRSYIALENMVNHVENLVQKLGLAYRIVKLCGGDMSFTSAMTYDFEVYSAGQDKWLEVSSVSNFESFQANRLKLRFKDEGEKKTRLAHTLNGSALALPRIVAALLENNQTSKGIIIPRCLIPYTGFEIID